MLVMSVAARHLGSDFSSTFCEACFDEQCFAAPREIDADSPTTYRQAMSGPEHAEWEASNDREIDNLASEAWSVRGSTRGYVAIVGSAQGESIRGD